jgi:hypothetical protein
VKGDLQVITGRSGKEMVVSSGFECEGREGSERRKEGSGHEGKKY